MPPTRVLAAALPLLASADLVAPLDEVSTYVKIREAPDAFAVLGLEPPRLDEIGNVSWFEPDELERKVEAVRDFVVFPGSGGVKSAIEREEARLGGRSIADVLRGAGASGRRPLRRGGAGGAGGRGGRRPRARRSRAP